jgi:S-sulfosulfanyl-L-cysteine sulfohydrolase
VDQWRGHGPAINQLGVDVFAPHWEFTYGIDRVKEVFGDLEKRGSFKGEFVAQNVVDITWGLPGDPVFHPYTIRELGGARLGMIGQAFPYTPISHPLRFVPDLSFGIREERVQAIRSTSCATSTRSTRSSCCRTTAWRWTSSSPAA